MSLTHLDWLDLGWSPGQGEWLEDGRGGQLWAPRPMGQFWHVLLLGSREKLDSNSPALCCEKSTRYFWLVETLIH